MIGGEFVMMIEVCEVPAFASRVEFGVFLSLDGFILKSILIFSLFCLFLLHALHSIFVIICLFDPFCSVHTPDPLSDALVSLFRCSHCYHLSSSSSSICS